MHLEWRVEEEEENQNEMGGLCEDSFWEWEGSGE